VFAQEVGHHVDGERGRGFAEEVEAGIRAHYPAYFAGGRKPSLLKPLLDEITTRLADQPAITVDPKTTTWAADAHKSALVVNVDFGEKERLQINGRAPAPPAVAGMGCHTTAWAIETQHANHLVSGATTDGQIITRLRAAVLRDLQSEVMGLAALLPIDQIRGRQLPFLFDQAATVLKAESGSQVAAAYLSFRNLLPYATVNEGDRGGHGEKKDGTLKETYDQKAIELAAERIGEELLKADKNVIKSLQDERDELGKELERWNFNPVLAQAVETARKQLETLAGDLGNVKKDRAALAESKATHILATRDTEHKKLWKDVQTFRKSA
jgi:hypothetical protein